jgi:hypothetical protein
MDFLKIFGDAFVNSLAANRAANANTDNDHKSRTVNIQAQSPHGGAWFTVGGYTGNVNDGFSMNMGMQNAQRQFPNHRIRAVDGHGRLLDML